MVQVQTLQSQLIAGAAQRKKADKTPGMQTQAFITETNFPKENCGISCNWDTRTPKKALSFSTLEVRSSQIHITNPLSAYFCVCLICLFCVVFNPFNLISKLHYFED